MTPAAVTQTPGSASVFPGFSLAYTGDGFLLSLLNPSAWVLLLRIRGGFLCFLNYPLVDKTWFLPCVEDL